VSILTSVGYNFEQPFIIEKVAVKHF